MIYIKRLNSIDTHKHKSQEKLSIKKLLFVIRKKLVNNQNLKKKSHIDWFSDLTFQDFLFHFMISQTIPWFQILFHVILSAPLLPMISHTIPCFLKSFKDFPTIHDFKPFMTYNSFLVLVKCSVFSELFLIIFSHSIFP